jgi:hypothetical protein
MICNIIGKITRYQADLYLSETSSEVFPPSSCRKWSFIEFKLIISTNSTVFQSLSFHNLKKCTQPMVAWSQISASLPMPGHQADQGIRIAGYNGSREIKH